MPKKPNRFQVGKKIIHSLTPIRKQMNSIDEAAEERIQAARGHHQGKSILVRHRLLNDDNAARIEARLIGCLPSTQKALSLIPKTT